MTSDLRKAAAEAGASYDALPYVSLPFPQMQPARLAGLAHLFGLAPPDVTRARVLEIGCAAGGHLIPLAARFPQARFLGLDPSERQIADGRARAAAAGLGNLELRAAGVEALGEADGRFDYILCHGVYSWVPQPVREAILAAIRDRLSADGIAYVSYNVLPGWRQLQAIREALIAATAGLVDPAARIARARDLLDLMRRGTDGETSWGRLWQAEAERLADARDDYLAHEFLEPDNAPCTFADFTGTAGRHGLAYLAEAELFTMLPENGPEDVAQDIRRLADNRLTGVESLLDLVNGRTFRQTLLVRAEAAGAIRRRIEAEKMDGLHLVAGLDIEAAPDEADGSRLWRDQAGRSISTPEPAAAGAIERLIAGLPGTTTIEDLLEGAEPAEAALARDAIFRMLLVGLVDVSSAPLHAAAAPGPRPQVFALARLDALRGAASTANLRHESVDLDEAARLILPLADGSRSLAQICTEAEKQHHIRGLSGAAEDLVKHTLAWAGRRGLLEA